MTAGRILKRARLVARLSQRDLARVAGVPQSTVARIELGGLSPRVDTLENLLRAASQTLSTEPRIGVGVDRSLIREFLEMTPSQRVRRLKSDARTLRMLDRAVIRDR